MLEEVLHKVKRKILKYYKLYFSVESSYTCILPDYIYLKRKFKLKTGYNLNLCHPVTYTEKLNWLKLYDRRPEYTMMVDKFAVREYVKHKIGSEYLVPLLGVWNNASDIEFDKLPNEFVLKCNHDNGVIICKDKHDFNIEQAVSELDMHLHRDYYKKDREWPYKNVKRKIICEQYIRQEGGKALIDYKFFCFNGKVKALFIATDRPFDTHFDFYDVEFNHLPIINGHENSDKPIVKPSNFDEMIEIAEKLAADIPHARIDLYNIEGRILFGEITLHHFGGFHPLMSREYEIIFGDWLILPR